MSFKGSLIGFIYSLMLFLAGCGPVKWTTYDGKIIEVARSHFRDKARCEEKYNRDDHPWRNACRQFGVSLQEIDPVNSMKFLKMACDEGTGCLEIVKSADIAFKRGVLTQELYSNYVSTFLLQKCNAGYIDNCWRGCNGQGEDQTQFLCIDISNFAQKFKDIDAERIAYGYNCVNTGLDSACENFARMGGQLDLLGKQKQGN